VKQATTASSSIFLPKQYKAARFWLVFYVTGSNLIGTPIILKVFFVFPSPSRKMPGYNNKIPSTTLGTI
jgi:hypothetical protein